MRKIAFKNINAGDSQGSVPGTALFIVVSLSLVIAILCSSIILTAYYFKLQYQKSERWNLLERNLHSGLALLLSEKGDKDSLSVGTLPGTEDDSVRLERYSWGLWRIGLCRSFIQKDTLLAAISIAPSMDSLKTLTLYLADEDRPVSVCGNTFIRGNASVPVAGVQEAYIDNRAYTGDKRYILGKKQKSDRHLPPIDTLRLEAWKSYVQNLKTTDTTLHRGDSLNVSFFKPLRVIRLGKKALSLSQVYLSGHVLLLSDTILKIDSTCHLENVIVMAKDLRLQHGFRGKGQFTGLRNLYLEKNTLLDYPSVLGVMTHGKRLGPSPQITLERNCRLQGVLFLQPSTYNSLDAFMDLGKKTTIEGMVYAPSRIRLGDSCRFDGGFYAHRVLFSSGSTNFENFIMDARMDIKGLSPYYLTSSIFPWSTSNNQILQWLERK